MSDWTSLKEIMRDLSIAQGCTVPASLEASFGNCAPPATNIEEDTEEAFYKSCGDVDFTKPPDFDLIQEMITRVNNEKKEVSKGDILLHSTLNPLSLEFVPGRKHETAAVKKRRVDRNVAIKSILEALELKTTINNRHIIKNHMNMFRPKPSPKKERQCETTSSSPSDPDVNNCEYTPSALANTYYNKYKENARVKKQITVDIWSRVEEEMKNMDLARRSSLEYSSYSSGHSSSDDTSHRIIKYGIYKVTLPHYRHLLLEDAEDCPVCSIAAKHGYSFQDDETNVTL